MLNVDDRILDNLNESELFLVMHIAKRMQFNRMTAWPSIETLAKDCKWDERTVKKWRDSLIARRFLGVEQRPGKATIYRFLKPGIGVFASLENQEGYVEEGGTKNVGGTNYEGAKNVVEGVQNMPPELVNNSELVNKKENSVGEENADETTFLVATFEAVKTPNVEAKKGKPAPVPKPPAVKLDFPECYPHFSDPAAMEKLWARWVKFRREIKKPIKSEDSALTQLKQLWKWTKGDTVQCTKIVEKSIAGGYMGLIEPEAQKPTFQAQPEKIRLDAPQQSTKRPTWNP